MNFVCLEEEEGDTWGEEKERISEREEEGPQTHLKFPLRVSLECKVGSGKWLKRDHVGTSLSILGLSLHTSTAGDTSSVPG